MIKPYNYTEDAVNQAIDDTLRQYIATSGEEICTCPRCRADITALALNGLRPYYVVSDEGSIYRQAAIDVAGGKAEVIAALTLAIQVVSKKPRH